MKQKIIDLLKTKFEGVDESILSRIADTKAAKAVTTDEEAETYVEGITLTHLLNSYGDIRSTEAQRTAVANYEKKHGLKDGKVVKAGDDHNNEPGDDDDDMPAWAKAIVESNQKLREELNTLNTDKLMQSRKQQFDALINKLPEKERRGYARTAYKDLSDEEFTSLLDEVGNEVDERLKETQTMGATFSTPFHRQANQRKAGEATDKEVEAVVGKM